MYDEQKVDEVVLALLHLNTFPDHGMTRAWKGFDWDSLNRLQRCRHDQRPAVEDEVRRHD